VVARRAFQCVSDAARRALRSALDLVVIVVVVAALSTSETVSFAESSIIAWTARSDAAIENKTIGQ